MRIIGTGSYMPEYILTNEELTHIVDTSDEWITERTGIKERRISKGEEDSDIIKKAGAAALKDSGIDPMELDMIVVGTFTNDYRTPSVSCIVQKEIGAYNAFCMDLNAACSGFLYSLQTAYAYMQAGLIKKALVIAGDNLSKMTDYTDRSTAVLFGDAAGAAVIDNTNCGSYSCILGTDASKSEALVYKDVPLVNLYVKNEIKLDHLHMDGRMVHKFVMSTIPKTIEEVIKKANISKNDVKYVLLHQANKKMNDMVAKKLDMELEKFPHNIERTGNTSAATIPCLLDEMNKDHKLNRGDKIIMCGFGGGLTWGAILLEW